MDIFRKRILHAVQINIHEKLVNWRIRGNLGKLEEKTEDQT